MLNNFIKQKKIRTYSQDYKHEGEIRNPDSRQNMRTNYTGMVKNIKNAAEKNNSKTNKIDITTTSQEIINFVITHLDSIESENMLENFVKLLHSVQEDISVKFENSKYLKKIQEIFNNKFEFIINYFIGCLQQTDIVKKVITENLPERLTELTKIIQSEFENFQSKIHNLSTNTNQQINFNSNSAFIDEEFVALINSLSQSIKEFMKSTKICIKLLTQNIESTENIFNSVNKTKSDITYHLNSNPMMTEGTKFSQSPIQKYIPDDTKLLRDKINSVMEQIDQLNSFKLNLSSNIKNIDDNCGKFYDEAKLIFRGLKSLHNERLNEFQKTNTDNSQNIKINANGMINNYSKISEYKYNSSDHKNNLSNNRSSEQLRNKRNVDTFSSNQRKLATNQGFNLNTSGSFMNPVLDYSYTYTPNYVKNSRNLSKYKTQLAHSRSGQNFLNKSTDHLNTRSKLSGGMNININTSDNFSNINTNFNTAFLNTSGNNNQVLHHEDSFLYTKLEETKARNQELLEEIGKIHELYVATQYENNQLKQENEVLKRNINYNEVKEHEIGESQPQQHLNSVKVIKILHNKSKSLGKILIPKQSNIQNNSNTPTPKIDFDKNDPDMINLEEKLSQLSLMVIHFISQMSTLQDAISNKANNIKEMKRDFEIKKKELLQFTNEIKINNKNSQQGNKEQKIQRSSKKGDTKLDAENNYNISNKSNKDETSFHFEKLKTEFEEEKVHLSKEIIALKNDITNLNEMVNSKNEEIKKLSNSLISAKKLEDDNKKLIKESNLLKTTNDTLDKENAKLKLENEQMRNKLNIYNKIVDMKQIAEDELTKAQVQIKELDSSLKNLKEELDLKNKLLDTSNKEDLEHKFQKNNQIMAEEINKKNAKIIELNENNKILTNEIDRNNTKINDINEKNKLLNNEIEYKNLNIKEFNDKVKKLNEEINQKTEKINEINLKIQNLSDENKRKNDQISSMNENIKNLTDEQNSKDSKIQEINKNLKEENNRKNDQIHEMKEKIKNLNDEINRKKILINEFIEKNKILNEEMNKKNSKFEEFNDKNNTLVTEINNKNLQITDLNDRIHSLNEELSEKTQQILEFKNKIDTLTKDLGQKNINIINLTEKNNEYKKAIDGYISQILQINSTIEQNTISKTNTEKEISDLKIKMNLLLNENKTLSEEMPKTIKLLKEHLQSLEKENSDLKIQVKNSSSSSNELISEIQDLTYKIKEYEQKIIPEINDKSMKELEKTKEIFKQIINEKDESATKSTKNFQAKEEDFLLQIKTLNESLKSKEIELSVATERFFGDLNVKEEENKALENDFKKKIEMINQEESNKEMQLAEKLKTVSDNLFQKEKELNDMAAKYNALSSNSDVITAKTAEIENLRLKLNEAENSIKTINFDYNTLKKEFTELSNLLKSAYLTITENFKESKTNSIGNKKQKANEPNRFRNNDEAFLFYEDLMINDENIDDDEVASYGLESKTKKNEEIASEIIQMFDTLIVELKDKKKINPKESQDLMMNSTKISEYMAENKRLKLLFDECTQVIYEAIRTTTPNMFEELNLKEKNELDSKNSNQIKSPSANSARSEGEFIHKAVEMFKNYNNGINVENKRLKKALEQSENNERKFKIMAEEYKSALELAMSRGNDNETKTNKNGNVLNTNLNSSLTFTKENAINFTVDDLVEENSSNISDSNLNMNNSVSDGNNNNNNINFETENTKNKKDIMNSPKNLENSVITRHAQEKEIKDLIAIQDDLVKKLAHKDEELLHYKETCEKLLRSSTTNYSGNKTIPIEKYEILLEHYNEQLEKLNEIETKYKVIKRDYEVAKSRLEINKNTNREDNNGKITIPGLTNNKGKPDVQTNEEENEIKEKLNKTVSQIGNKNSTNAYTKTLNNTVATVKKGVSMNYLAMLNNSGVNDSNIKTQNSGRSKKTESNFMQEAINQAIGKYEEHEQLLAEQLTTIKEELKETRQQRDNFKRKYEESITLQDGKKNEILNMLRQAVEKLVLEININSKTKELITVILRILDYNDQQINNVLNNKDKKKNFFAFLK